MDSLSTKACPAQWLVMDNRVIKRLAKGKLPAHRSQLELGRLPSEGGGHTFESCRVRHLIFANFGVEE
jgi:hypothetical protein